MNGKEEEIYNILYKKKEINDKTPNLRTEDDKKKLKSLSYKISKFPKDLIDDIKTKFPFLQRKPKTAEQRKEQAGGQDFRGPLWGLVKTLHTENKQHK